MYAGVEGVTQTMVDWGRLMQQAKNISTAKRVHPDIATTSLSIFTDNGAFYNAPVTTLPSVHRPQPRSTAVPRGTRSRCTFIVVLDSQHSCLLFSSNVLYNGCFFILLLLTHFTFSSPINTEASTAILRDMVHRLAADGITVGIVQLDDFWYNAEDGAHMRPVTTTGTKQTLCFRYPVRSHPRDPAS